MNACPKCHTVLTKSFSSLLIGISYPWPQGMSISPGELLLSTNFLWYFCVSGLPLLRNLAKEWTARTELNAKGFPKGMVARRKYTVVCLLQFNGKLRTLGTLSPVSNLDGHRHLDHRLLMDGRWPCLPALQNPPPRLGKAASLVLFICHQGRKVIFKNKCAF